MRTDRKHYVISAGTDLPFAEAVNRARDLLQEAGYGMLCEIVELSKRSPRVEVAVDGRF